jgi:hypothetical protein
MEMVKMDLKASWKMQVEEGWMTYSEMVESLRLQIDGIQDLSGDELTEDRAKMMGWDYDKLMDDDEADEWNIWTDIVVESAREFIAEI